MKILRWDGLWVDPKLGHYEECMCCTPEPYVPGRDPRHDEYIGDVD